MEEYKPTIVKILGNDKKEHEITTSQYHSYKNNGFIKLNEQAIEVLNIFEEREMEVKLDGVKKVISAFMDTRDLARQVIKIQPFYYDDARMWWFWDKELFCWKMTDRTNILNVIGDVSSADTISGKEKTEIMEALEQEARKNKPKDMERNWIQFREEVYDVVSGDRFKATSEYFVTNPIPYALNSDNFMETPNMDRIFEEWVGKDYVKTLYEILAYCLITDYPINRMFCFLGAGMNGKSKFLELLAKFVGSENCVSTELDLLLKSRFEVTKLHKKLVCQMGEANFNEMTKTSILKKLTGGDMIGFEYKNKTPFDGKNYAKILISTNNLPTTTDKTVGFYRRWMIIDFPNEFTEKKDILKDIPEEEYSCLALKCCHILKDLLSDREFHKEGTVEERQKRYEDKSDPLAKFITEKCETTNPNDFIYSFEFEQSLNDWCKDNNFRKFSGKAIGAKMKEIGAEATKKRADFGDGNQIRCWYGIGWKRRNDRNMAKNL